MVCFHTCLNSVVSAFKSTDLVNIHCFSKENFVVTVKGFTCASLVCREVHMRTKKSSHPWGCCVNLPEDELFAGVRSPVLIWISSYCDIAVSSSSQDSVIFSGLLTEKSDLCSCFCVLTMRHRGGLSEVCFETVSLYKSARRHPKIMVKFMTLLLVPLYSVSTQVILQEMEWPDHCFGLSN